MTPTWITALVSGVAALIGGLLAPTLTRVFRKRDEVLILRREWAKVLLEAFATGAIPDDNPMLGPSVDLVLLDPRSSQMVTSWVKARMAERDTFMQVHEATRPPDDRGAEALITWWAAMMDEGRRLSTLQAGVSAWAREDWRWPMLRFSFLRRRAWRRAMDLAGKLDAANRGRSESLGG